MQSQRVLNGGARIASSMMIAPPWLCIVITRWAKLAAESPTNRATATGVEIDQNTVLVCPRTVPQKITIECGDEADLYRYRYGMSL